MYAATGKPVKTAEVAIAMERNRKTAWERLVEAEGHGLVVRGEDRKGWLPGQNHVCVTLSDILRTPQTYAPMAEDAEEALRERAAIMSVDGQLPWPDALEVARSLTVAGFQPPPSPPNMVHWAGTTQGDSLDLPGRTGGSEVP